MKTLGDKLVKRMATTSKILVSPVFLSETRLDYQQRYKSFHLWHKIPKDLTVNFDLRPLPYVCASKYTLENQGTSSVFLVGKSKIKQVTWTFAISQLPMQLIYEGKTRCCLPQINFPKKFNVTCTENHWISKQKSIEFIQTKILICHLIKSEYWFLTNSGATLRKKCLIWM